MALLLEPPVSEVLREPARGALGRKILGRGRVDDGDAELGLDRVQQATYGIGMHLGRDVEHVEAAFDVFERRFDHDCLPLETGEPAADGKKPPPVGHRARHEIR